MKTLDPIHRAAYFNEVFKYEPTAGEIFNKVQRNTRAKASTKVGWMNDSGYLITTVCTKKYRLHHIVWMMHNGSIPEGYEIDHINRLRSDNRIENLRLATRHEQNLNLSCRVSKSGETGVVFNKKDAKWQAQIGFKGQHIYLGQFKEKGDAIAARKSAEVQFGFRSQK